MEEEQVERKTVSRETPRFSSEMDKTGKLSWRETQCKAGIWGSGWLSGESARLFRTVWSYMINLFVDHGYTEMMIYGENEHFPAILKLTLHGKKEEFSLDELPVKYICHQSGYKAMVQAVFQEEQASDWLEAISNDLEQFLFQMNVPYRSTRLDSQENQEGKGVWRIDVWLPERQEYLELCRIGCSQQDNSGFLKLENNKNLWAGKIEDISGRNLFLAVIENGYNRQEGGIRIPSVLIPYMMEEWIP